MFVLVLTYIFCVKQTPTICPIYHEGQLTWTAVQTEPFWSCLWLPNFFLTIRDASFSNCSHWARLCMIDWIACYSLILFLVIWLLSALKFFLPTIHLRSKAKKLSSYPRRFTFLIAQNVSRIGRFQICHARQESQHLLVLLFVIH